jgi:hypothetical protein
LIVVEVAEYTGAATPLKVTTLLEEFGLKFVPVMVTGLSGESMPGVKPEIVGAPVAVVTVNELLLVAVPDGDVTLMTPVVADEGTVATI